MNTSHVACRYVESDMVYCEHMNRNDATGAEHTRAEQLRRIIIWTFIVAVPWVPGGVALAMVLTGHSGH